MSKLLIRKYISEYNTLINNLNLSKILELKKMIIDTKKRKGIVYVFGNGGSLSTANHFAVDMTKNAKVKTISLSNDNLITCFSNDYGFDKWIKKSIEYYVKKPDLVIFLTVSGNSKNIVNALKLCKKKKIKTFSLTGHKNDNLSNKLSNNFLWINSMSYNAVEIIHNIILLTVVDLIIGNNAYTSKR
tara:strand:+ start:121 stop:681 length:561 start_codon:yes stop_codon:yes gene_type:complete